MQLSLVLASAIMGSALAGPLGARQQAPKAFKLPYKTNCRSPVLRINAPLLKEGEDCVGTWVFCNTNYQQENFANPRECRESRGLAILLPFQEPDLSRCSGGRQGSERCLGTLAFCNKAVFDPSNALKKDNFVDAKDCLESREPAPGDTSRKLSFKQPNFGSVANCGTGGGAGSFNSKDHSEGCKGTILYCEKGYYREFGESFDSAKDCIESREPAPSSANPDDSTPSSTKPDDTESAPSKSTEPAKPVSQSKPTRDEANGAPVTPQRILEIYGRHDVACEEDGEASAMNALAANEIYCTAKQKKDQVDVKDGLSPLCQQKGGCEECRMGTSNNWESDFTCRVKSPSNNQKQDLAEGLTFSD